jgi:hypothetical protein
MPGPRAAFGSLVRVFTAEGWFERQARRRRAIHIEVEPVPNRRPDTAVADHLYLPSLGHLRSMAPGESVHSNRRARRAAAAQSNRCQTTAEAGSWETPPSPHIREPRPKESAKLGRSILRSPERRVPARRLSEPPLPKKPGDGSWNRCGAWHLDCIGRLARAHRRCDRQSPAEESGSWSRRRSRSI